MYAAVTPVTWLSAGPAQLTIVRRKEVWTGPTHRKVWLRTGLAGAAAKRGATAALGLTKVCDRQKRAHMDPWRRLVSRNIVLRDG